MQHKLVFCALLSFTMAAPAATTATAAPRDAGAVYTMTNSAAGNEVLAFTRRADGSLRFSGAEETGGLGSGDALGNQGGVVLSEDHRRLFVVNAGSNELSVFDVRRRGLVLTDVAPTGGVRPVSVAVHGDIVYVVHDGGSAGDVDGISGFSIDADGHLAPLAGTWSPLSGPSTGPAQAGFSPDGRHLLVTEKGTSRIDVFPVDRDGYVGSPVFNASAGMTPFSFDFGRRGQLFVSEVFGGAEDAGAVSSYSLDGDGSLTVISGSVPNTETAPCWLVVSKGGRYAFTTNTPDDSLSAYAIGFNGSLELVDADGRTGEAGPGSSPLDMDLSDDGRFLYTLDIGSGSISTFRVMPDGGLEKIRTVGGLPAGVNGLAAR